MSVAVWAAARHRPGAPGYESWFLRANHPSRPLACWIRYTTTTPTRGARFGERWALWFDGETGHITAARDRVPAEAVAVDPRGLDVTLGDARLRQEQASGHIDGPTTRMAWDLRWVDGNRPPSLLLPAAWHDRPFPAANAVCLDPGLALSGTVWLGDTAQQLSDWPGTLNHNWGRRHTDRYAWCQVTGFDDDPEATLECAAAQVRIGPMWSPVLCFLTFCAGGRRWERTGWRQALTAHGGWSFGARAQLSVQSGPVTLAVDAPADAGVHLAYADPDGRPKDCWNTKLARCVVTVEGRRWVSAHRAALELLADAPLRG
jgi:hypothetical protein